jgi:N6-L-threonylcarbamoyladenine synthase
MYIIPVIYEALVKAGLDPAHPNIDAIAVTVGPGLIGSLLVGVETAKSLSYAWNKPLIPVNHLFGHIYANFIQTNETFTRPTFPAIVLVVSGGHTDLVFMKTPKSVAWLGGTRDDAAGEAFDKVGRLLQLPYPAGPIIEKLAEAGNEKRYHFPRPLLHDGEYDFSFSGLKTAVLREVEQHKKLTQELIADVSRGVQDAICEVLVYKTLLAAKEKNVKSILLSGGVAANQHLREIFLRTIEKSQLSFSFAAPEKFLCTDNAAMIAAAGFFQDTFVDTKSVSANPELYFD